MRVSRKPVWQMIREAIDQLGGKASHKDIIDLIRSKYGDINEGTIRCQITICTVNSPSRVYYPENKRPRKATDQRYDFLYSTSRGQVILYNPEEHGEWSIVEKEGRLTIAQVGVEEAEETVEEVEAIQTFPLESHLRDFLARNLDTIERGLTLFKDEDGREGVEYPTDIGPIDILAIDRKGDLVVFELKLSKGPDRALGQLMRYMGWVRKNLSKGREVRGIIVAQSIGEGLKFAASENPKILLLEYEVSFKVSPVS